MNRQQRRNKIFNRGARPMQRAVTPVTRQMTIGYGHSNTHVVIEFSHETRNLHLTPAEADAIVHNILKMKEALLAHQTNPRPDSEATRVPL